MPKHRTPTRYYSSTTITLAFLSLTIYILQLLGKSYALAAFAAGILIVFKVFVELQHHSHRIPHHHSSARAAGVPLVRVQSSIAGCYLCGELRRLRPCMIRKQRVGICQHCHHRLSQTINSEVR